ncbi:MAG: hypothetical protein HDS41_07240 [Bacteroides sp.]|nr:hypothetical protein [Bacteroides sp.]
MEHKSPWTLISATGFLIAYICADCFIKPFKWMVYIFFYVIGESELIIDPISQSFEWEMELFVGIISVLWFLWLAVMPIIIGFRTHVFKEIPWKNKWIWLYLIIFTAISVWGMFIEGKLGGFLLGLGVSLLPMVYWCISNRHRRSPIQLILNDRKIRWYLIYAVFMLTAITIGLKDIYSMKLLGLLTFPAFFYIMLIRSFRLGTVLTRCCIALFVSGLLYWLTLDEGETASVVMLIIAVVLIIYVGITMIIKTKRCSAAVFLMIIVPAVIIPSILGFNPYIILDADYTRMYASNLSVRQGVYVVEQYAELAEKGTPYYWCKKHGLRDRYGMILPMEYNELKVIDGWGRFIATNYHLCNGSRKSDQRYGVFDLRKRKFVVDPANMEVMDIERIDDKSFKLINLEEKHFATLYLWGEYQGKYYNEAHVEPHFAE